MPQKKKEIGKKPLVSTGGASRSAPKSKLRAHARAPPTRDRVGVVQPKAIVILIFSVLTLICLIVCATYPWYQVQQEGTGTISYDWTSYTSADGKSHMYDSNDAVQVVFAISFAFILGAAVCTLLLLVLSIPMICKDHFRDFCCKLLGFIFVSGAIGLTVMSCLTFLSITKALSSTDRCTVDNVCTTFWGSEDVNQKTTSWGPGAGWIIAVLCLPLQAPAFLLICYVSQSRG